MCSHQKIIIGLFLLLSDNVNAESLAAFSSDGCSHFPDGTVTEIKLWCGCCIAHDLAYWQGGSRAQKKQADESLRECVFQSTNNQLLAETMYLGVRFGGLPIYPVWYRWGYGWDYGRGFQVLNTKEKQLVARRLQEYSSIQAKSFCEFDYPPVIYFKQSWRELVEKWSFKANFLFLQQHIQH